VQQTPHPYTARRTLEIGMEIAERLGALTEYVARTLGKEFPGWQIEREPTGRWAAKRAGWGVLYGQSSAELGDRLRNYATHATSHER
jgi:hypothetical protein